MLKSLFKNILTVEKNIEIIKVLLKVIIIALHHLSLATTKRDKQHVYRYKTTFITILSTRHLPPGVLKFHASLHAWSLLKALIMTQLWWKPATYASYTGCSRRNVRDFGRVFLRSNYTDITQNTYNPKLNCYGDIGQRSLKLWQLLLTYWLPNTYWNWQ